MQPILGKLETALGLVGPLLSGAGIQASALIPLLRAACASLTVEHLELLHMSATGIIRCMCCAVGEQFCKISLRQEQSSYLHCSDCIVLGSSRLWVPTVP